MYLVITYDLKLYTMGGGVTKFSKHKPVRSVALIYVFTKLLNVWPNGSHLDSHICLHSPYIKPLHVK